MPEKFPTSITDTVDPPEAETTSEYDRLFMPVSPEEQLAGLTATHELERDPRLEVLFAPKTSRKEAPQPTHLEDLGYAHLFEQDPAKAAELSRKYAEAEMARQDYFRQFPELTDEMKKAAWTRLWEARRDPKVDTIMTKYQGMVDMAADPLSIVDMVRTNAGLRYELGSYYLRDKLPKLHGLPHRVAVNSQKNPNHPGYRHIPVLTSQEYSAMLALSIIDGTYKEPGKGDEVMLGNDGTAEVGQHRAAANKLIDDFVFE